MRTFQVENCMGKGLKAKMGKAGLQVASDRKPNTYCLQKNWNQLVHSEAQVEEYLASGTRISFSLMDSFMDSSPQVVVASNSHTITSE